MQHNYTRQRQGRDFSSKLREIGLLNYLRNAETSTESNYNNISGIIGDNDSKDDTEKKSLLDKLEQYKEETESHTVPVDGHEPPEKER